MAEGDLRDQIAGIETDIDELAKTWWRAVLWPWILWWRRAWTRDRNPADPPSAWKTVNRFGIPLRRS
jgi:hypothetical protein